MQKHKKSRPDARRRRLRVVNFIDEVDICGVRLRRLTLPNGKRMFEEEGLRELMCGEVMEPTPGDFERFEQFTRPEVRH